MFFFRLIFSRKIKVNFRRCSPYPPRRNSVDWYDVDVSLRWSIVKGSTEQRPIVGWAMMVLVTSLTEISRAKKTRETGLWTTVRSRDSGSKRLKRHVAGKNLDKKVVHGVPKNVTCTIAQDQKQKLSRKWNGRFFRLSLIRNVMSSSAGGKRNLTVNPLVQKILERKRRIY